MKLKFYVGFVLLLPFYVQCTVTDNLRQTLVQTCKAAEVVSVFVATHMALALVHECAHIFAARIAISAGAETEKMDWNLELEPFNHAICPTATYPRFKNGIVSALVAGIAPMMGFAGSYAALKANTIGIEYFKDYNIKRALLAGMKKDLVNKDQNSALRAAALFHIGCNAAMLFPLKTKGYETHGHQILKDLKIIS